MQGRQSKGLSQKDLATVNIYIYWNMCIEWVVYNLLRFHFQKICEKQQIVTDYEAGRGIPNNMILGKIERVIGIKLRGKDRGQPLAPPGKKWENANTAACTNSSGGNSGGNGVSVAKVKNRLSDDTSKSQQQTATATTSTNNLHSHNATTTSANNSNKRK